MALNDDAVLTAAVGYVYTGPVGTAGPAASALDTLDLANPSSWVGVPGWTCVGHTSRGDMPEFGFEGGDTEVRGTWQKKKLREITTEDPVDYLIVYLQQFDEHALELYYGENASAAPGVFGVSGSANANEKAFLVIIEDGGLRIGFRAAKASVRREDAIQLPVDDFASLPIRATFLNHNNENLFEWINEELFNNGAPLPVYNLVLGGATGGTYTLGVNGQPTAAINHDANATAIKSALGAVDDGLPESVFTVTADGSDFDIASPVVITVDTDSTTGGTGVTVTPA